MRASSSFEKEVVAPGGKRKYLIKNVKVVVGGNERERAREERGKGRAHRDAKVERKGRERERAATSITERKALLIGWSGTRGCLESRTSQLLLNTTGGSEMEW